MSRSPLPKFVNDVKNDFAEISDSSVTTILTAGADGNRLENLVFTTDDSAALSANVFIEVPAVGTYQIASIAIPAEAGTVDTVPSVDGLNSTDNPWISSDSHSNTFVDIEGANKLEVQAVGLTAGKVLNVFASSKNLSADS